MLIKDYTLPQLLDLALRVPEIGVVNFNILHTVIKTIIEKLGLQKTKAWCNIENPVVARTALSSMKKSPHHTRKSFSEEHRKPPSTAPKKKAAVPVSKPTEDDDGDDDEDSAHNKHLIHDEKKEHKAENHEKESQEEEGHEEEDKEEEDHQEEDHEEEDKEEEDYESDHEEGDYEKEDSEEEEEEEEEKEEEEDTPASKLESIFTKLSHRGAADRMSTMWRSTNMNRRMDAAEEGLEKLAYVMDKLADSIAQMSKTSIDTLHEVEDIIMPQVTNLSDTVHHIEDCKADKSSLEDISKHTDSLDIEKANKDDVKALIEEKMAGTGKADSNVLKKAFEDRILDLEERLRNLLDQLGLDDEMTLGDRFDALWAQMDSMKSKIKTPSAEEPVGIKKIEEQERLIKYLRDQMETVKTKMEIVETDSKSKSIQIDALQNSCSDLQYSKADKGDMDFALDNKADKKDLALKVDRTEFVATVEDLGDSIEELVTKFAKNDIEWHTAVESINEQLKLKLSTADYETLQIPIQNRIRALMYGFKKLKTIINNTLYPEAAGVTKCISCGRPAELAGTKCKPCGDMESLGPEFAGSTPSKTLSLSDLKRPDTSDSDKNEGKSFLSLPESTDIPPKAKSKTVNMDKLMKTLTDGNEAEIDAPNASLIKEIALPHRKSKKEMDEEFDLLMTTSSRTRFCGGHHTKTSAQQRGVTFSEFELPVEDKDEAVLVGYDKNWYSGSFPVEKDSELPQFDEDPSSVDMEQILDSCYDPYPPLPPKKYSDIPRYCGGQHTLTDALQRGLNFSPFKVLPSPVLQQIELEGSDGGVYVGLNRKPGTSHETSDKKDQSLEPDTSTLQPSVLNMPSNQKGGKAASLKRKGLTIVDIPANQLPKMDSAPSAPRKKKLSEKRK